MDSTMFNDSSNVEAHLFQSNLFKATDQSADSTSKIVS